MSGSGAVGHGGIVLRRLPVSSWRWSSYAAVRGGILAINAGSTTKPSDLNPFAIATVTLMVRMFTKDAPTKLGEVFQTYFQLRRQVLERSDEGNAAAGSDLWSCGGRR